MIVLVLLGLYGWGVVVLHRRGVNWPFARIIWWLLGLGIILLVTATGVEGYGMELFSIHMIQHMVLNMLAPVFLVLGAPVTLLLRALPTGTGTVAVCDAVSCGFSIRASLRSWRIRR